MASKSRIIVALLALTQASGIIQTAQAQPGDHSKHDRIPNHNKQDGRQGARQDSGKYRQPMPPHVARQGIEMPSPSYSGQVQIGAYFQPQHREAAREYYGRPENRGFCPPGLGKKGNGCLPPGQAKKWRQGYPLPSSVVYYEVPRSVVLTLGVPPSGYRYVRVASDILLIAVGTRIVVDAIEDLVR